MFQHLLATNQSIKIKPFFKAVVCALKFYTSGGFQLTERLRRSVTLALARSGADQAHTLN